MILPSITDVCCISFIPEVIILFQIPLGALLFSLVWDVCCCIVLVRTKIPMWHFVFLHIFIRILKICVGLGLSFLLFCSNWLFHEALMHLFDTNFNFNDVTKHVGLYFRMHIPQRYSVLPIKWIVDSDS